MGLYDELRFNRVMPDGFDGNGRVFQTKDFGHDMITYEVTDQGRLIEPTWGGERGHLCVEGEPDGWRDTQFHGWLNFYTYLTEREAPPSGEWHEYIAKFTDGQLVEVRTASFRRLDSVGPCES